MTLTVIDPRHRGKIFYSSGHPDYEILINSGNKSLAPRAVSPAMVQSKNDYLRPRFSRSQKKHNQGLLGRDTLSQVAV